ncbi:MAG: type III pantothenate kinase [Microscillaceae bacterium]|nr:type III pantothenate kinase [Microscillaceae bacterium]
MLLAVDIGNSNIVLGIDYQKKWHHIWRIETSLSKGKKDYAMAISDLFLEHNFKPNVIRQIVLSSVVPPLTEAIEQVLTELFEQKPLLIGPAVYSKLSMAIDRPHEIGSDLVANAVAAYHKFRQASIVVDFGTALTFTVVSDTGQILGVSIAPGLKTAMYSLFANTAQLPEVPLELPPSVIGKNTVTALQSGVLWGYVGLVEYMLKQIKSELKDDCKVVATGGLAKIIPALAQHFDEIDQSLTLNGLRIISEIFTNQSEIL